MHRDHSENAPRGTWNDDSSSERAGESRRSVSGPYRDATEAARLRKAALLREVDELDGWIRRRERAASDLIALDRALRPPETPRFVALRAIARGLGTLVPAFLLGAFVSGLATYAPTPVAIVAHDTPGVVALAGQRFVVSRSIVDRIVATSGAGARVGPYVEKGAVVGLLVDSLAPASELRELGLFEGDIILAVDDHVIARPDGARDAFATLRTAWAFDVVVRRGDRLRTIRYEVVG
jgi:hypothetical protein